MGDAHHCSGLPVSEMTYTVSSGTLNSTILYHTIPYHTIPSSTKEGLPTGKISRQSAGQKTCAHGLLRQLERSREIQSHQRPSLLIWRASWKRYSRVIRDINPGQYVNNLRFADDVDLLEKDRDRLQSSLVDDSRAGEMGLSLYKD